MKTFVFVLRSKMILFYWGIFGCICFSTVECFGSNHFHGLISSDGNNVDYDKEFDNFAQKFGRKHKNDKEKQFRKETFTKNLKTDMAYAKNQRGTAKFGVTNFMDWTDEEFQALNTLKLEDLDALHKQPPTGNPSAEAGRKKRQTVPANWDWRDSNAVTSVKTQGTCAACYAFAAAAVAESQYLIVQNLSLDLSEQELTDCTSVGRNGCGGGDPRAALDYIINTGVATEAADPYLMAGGTCITNPAGPIYNISSWSTSLPSNATYYYFDEDQAVIDVYNIGPGIMSIFVPTSMRSYISGVYHPTVAECQGIAMGHALTAIGYGVDSASGLPYWLLKNSYGPGWGQNGFGMFYRGDQSCSMGYPLFMGILDRPTAPTPPPPTTTTTTAPVPAPAPASSAPAPAPAPAPSSLCGCSNLTSGTGQQTIQPCNTVSFGMDVQVLTNGISCTASLASANCSNYRGYGLYINTQTYPEQHTPGYMTFWTPTIYNTWEDAVQNYQVSFLYQYGGPNGTVTSNTCTNMCLIDEQGNHWVNANSTSFYNVVFIPYCGTECHMYAVVMSGSLMNLNTGTIATAQYNTDTPLDTPNTGNFIKVFGGSCNSGCSSISYPQGMTSYTPNCQIVSNNTVNNQPSATSAAPAPPPTAPPPAQASCGCTNQTTGLGGMLSIQPCGSVGFGTSTTGIHCGANPCGSNLLGSAFYINTPTNTTQSIENYMSFWAPTTYNNAQDALMNQQYGFMFHYSGSAGTPTAVECPNMCMVDETGNYYVNNDPSKPFNIMAVPYCNSGSDCSMIAVLTAGSLRNTNTSAVIGAGVIDDTPFDQPESNFIRVFGGTCTGGCGSLAYPRGLTYYTASC